MSLIRDMSGFRGPYRGLSATAAYDACTGVGVTNGYRGKQLSPGPGRAHTDRSAGDRGLQREPLPHHVRQRPPPVFLTKVFQTLLLSPAR